MLEDVGVNIVPTVRAALLLELKKHDVKIITNAPIKAFHDRTVSYGNETELKRIENVDAVITAVGVRPNNSLVEELIAAGYSPENIICLGDANGRGDTLLNSKAACEAALTL